MLIIGMVGFRMLTSPLRREKKPALATELASHLSQCYFPCSRQRSLINQRDEHAHLDNRQSHSERRHVAARK